jgi:dihydrofolate reductase
MAGRSPRKPVRPKISKFRPAKKGARQAGGRAGRVHLYVGISLDGYIAAPDGGVDWLNPYADARAGFAPFIKTIGSAIMGRATYDYAVARGYGSFGDMPSYVVTHRPFPSPSPSVIPYSGDLADLVRQIRERHPRDIWLMGGGNVTKSFQEADLIDIWSVAFVPTLLGAGLPMFPPAAFGQRRVRLTRTHTYPSGVVELRYERRRR